MTDDAAFDALLGVGIQQIRESMGLTQARLAEAMVARGHAWHQQTVVKTEKGLRPLRFVEALALADILHVDVTALDGRRREDVVVQQIRRHLHECSEATAAVQKATQRLDAARAGLAEALRQGGSKVPEPLREASRTVLHGQFPQPVYGYDVPSAEQS
ncbi:helix-turn-helix transcriptional regulator [Gephyromycinifex aptenodytis]|uniref:helix-turn-helix transcriptional regulator n=1 Tax=Gephyromycinifex aptenodytis TaxID=2716227 RepID=UPI001444BF37|nr:helix-turn-helix transcriptional regulator [Gephyromycinifex aptenodytis]